MATASVLVDTLKELRRGEFLTEFTRELQGLVAAVRATGKSGRLTITMTVRPASHGDINLLMIDDDVKVMPPKLPNAATALYATDDNTLQRKDPRQPDLAGLRSPASVTRLQKDGTDE